MADALFITGEDVPQYLHDVELISVGRKWKASTGTVTVTSEHLRDAARAANEDPHVQPPRIRLGHTSPLNDAEPQWDPFAALGDAAPVFGTFTNLRVVNDGAVLIGDVDRILTWLALTAPAAYPNRSSEAVWGVAAPQFDVQTAGGERYQMVLTGVALLGVELPAIQDLEDLSALMTSGPTAVAAKSALSATDIVVTPDAASALSMSVDTIWMRCYEWLDGENDIEADTRYWWPRELLVDDDGGLFVTVDDDDGHMWRASVATDGKDDVTFELGDRARYEVVPVAAAARVVASFARPSRPDPEPSRPPAAAASNAATERPNTEEGANMDADVREILVGQGLDPDAATEDQINAANIFAAAAKLNPPVPAGDSVVANDETEQAPAVVEVAGNDDATPVDTERVPVAASRELPDGAVIIDADELARLRAGAETATRLAAEQTTRERDGILCAARDEGRFPPARLAHYTRLYDTDPEGTRTLLTADEKSGGLAKGTVPLAAKSTAPDPEGLGDDGLSGADREFLAASRSRMGFKQEVQS